MSNVLLPHHPFLIYGISIEFIYRMDGEEFILYLLIKHTKHKIALFYLILKLSFIKNTVFVFCEKSRW